MPVVVAFVSQKGGVGKSTLARALLAVAAHSVRSRLADLDPQQASVREWERTRERTNSGAACEVVAYKTVDQAVAAAHDVELLIIDAPAGATPDTLRIAARSHVVVQPTGASLDDLRPAIVTFHELVNAGIPRQRLCMAVCRVLSDGEEARTRQAIEHAGYEVLAGAIPERIAYREAQDRGHAITETRNVKLNERADALIEALLRKVGQEVRRIQRAKPKRPRRSA
jgi:chromosome partitioning protein